MAVSIVAQGYTGASNGGTVSISVPGGIADGDILFALCACDDNIASATVGPTGWQEINFLSSSSGGDQSQGQGYLPLDGTETGTWDIGVDDTSEEVNVAWMVIRGLDPDYADWATTGTNAIGTDNNNPNPDVAAGTLADSVTAGDVIFYLFSTRGSSTTVVTEITNCDGYQVMNPDGDSFRPYGGFGYEILSDANYSGSTTVQTGGGGSDDGFHARFYWPQGAAAPAATPGPAKYKMVVY